MATYAETKIGEAFFARLGTVGFSPAFPVSWENSDFTKPNGAYLEARLLPNKTEQATLGTTGLNRHQGIFQVNVVWPKNAGTREAIEAAGRIIGHFKRGTDMTREGLIVTVDEPPYRMSGFNDEDNGSRYVVPVTIPYRADVPNP